MRRYIMGTAGHVDHGKTELIKALTGRDTDRLKEEKERGISIDLGFAPFVLDENTFIGVVDVPGHERFIKNMVAGAGGVDIALLLIAADEGVMPQTQEHLEVLKSLAINNGIVVISKCDLAEEEMIEILRSEIEDLTAGTFLEEAPVILTSARTGVGLEELKRELINTCSHIEERDVSGPFRLPVDRVFVKEGIGAVVTGSCYSGRVNIGDTLDLLPSGKKIRVREIQSFEEKRESGSAGERLAIALQGVKVGEVFRGDVLVTPSKFNVSYLLDARIDVATYIGFELKNRQRVRIHHGAREVLGRLILLEQDGLRSGESALIQLRLESPVVAEEGDHFVIRQYSPQRVIGGGRVLNPVATKHKRFKSDVLEDLQLIEKGDAKEILEKTIAVRDIAGMKFSELEDGEAEEIIARGRVILVEGYLFHASAVDALAEKVRRMAKEYHDAHPLLYGIDKEELRQRVKFPHSSSIFNSLLDTLGMFVKGNRVRVDGDEISISASVQKEMDSLEATLKRAGLSFLSTGELKKQYQGRVDFSEALQFLRESGRVVKIGDDGIMHIEAIEMCKKEMAALFLKKEKVGVVDIKQVFNITRKHAIPLLEYTDEKRITVRVGNDRVKGPALGDG